MDRQFGAVFKALRLNRGLKLKDVADDRVISLPQLSRFERGLTQITIDKLFFILRKVNIRLEEYLYAVNGYADNPMDVWFEILQQNVMKGKIDKLRQELNRKPFDWETGNTYSLNRLMVTALISHLDPNESISDKDLIDLSDYLFNVEFWSFYEILLLMNTSRILSPDLMISLTRTMLDRTNFYHEIKKNIEHILRISLNTCLACLDCRRLNDAAYFMKYIEGMLTNDTQLYERTVFLYIKGYYNVLKHDNKGFDNMEKAWLIAKYSESEHLARCIHDHLEKVKNNLEF
ncbi:helix-turn-helix domain-containing protein [Streptococcus didelphis]|uniref:Helix-turn-helix domain-containing protein n=1 Tax=Streptococcus didelphis TaxID=102886 RepID=A0ABY9LGK2_9STRE|nr:Rgg/GadR/MutR family transcriptional regulator [Streptococcus didelphis]WMB28022.1 helix-turn-helix domain-containing protein [Streptococcus didelphis]WMB29928.1 helix-turn-helix domain-containing protein [Streptococcus didelphis]